VIRTMPARVVKGRIATGFCALRSDDTERAKPGCNATLDNECRHGSNHRNPCCCNAHCAGNQAELTCTLYGGRMSGGEEFAGLVT